LDVPKSRDGPARLLGVLDYRTAHPDAFESRLRARAAGSHLNSSSKTERKCGNPALASVSEEALE